MPEPIEPTLTEQTPPLDTTEVETLRRVNGEILTKRQKDKEHISALKATIAELQGKLSEAGDTIKDITIGGPLKSMAESMSTAPELFLEQFSKHYKLEMVKGALTLLSSDGKAVLSQDGFAVPFERDALVKYLTDEKHPQAKTFRAITVVSRASGGATGYISKSSSPARKPAGIEFGLR